MGSLQSTPQTRAKFRQARVEPAFDGFGRVVGQYVRDADGRLWLEKRRLNPEKHALRKPPSWATDADHLRELRRRNGAGVRLHLTTGETLSASLDDFERHGVTVSRGFGAQVALPVGHWRSDADRATAGQLT